MATLKDYFGNNTVELAKFIQKHDLKYFIETGTGIGDTIEFVKGFFDKSYSIEVIPEIYEKARIRFESETNVLIICNDSKNGLNQILSDNSDYFVNVKPILFFLDAHFPGADFGLAQYDSEKDPDKRIPLQRELETIVNLRGPQIKRDCFIIDDLRIYEDGEYGDGNWPHRKELGGDGIGFIYDMFEETHHIYKDFRFQGFVILTPMI